MITTTLSFNKNNTIFSQCISRLKGFMLLYGALLFICVPLTTILSYDALRNNFVTSQGILFINTITDVLTIFDLLIEIFISTVVPVFMAMLIFKYLHNKNAIDFYHSLPVTRTSLLVCNFICGYLAIAIPFILNYILKIGIVFSAYKQFGVLTFGLKNILVFCTIIFIVYAFCTLVAVSVGTTFECFGYSLAVCGALSVIGIITTSFCNFLYGFAKQSIYFKNSFNLSPFGLVATYIENGNNIDVILFLVWGVLAVLALLGANYIYKKRKSESADVAGRKNPLSILIRFIGSFCGGIVLFLIFEYNIHFSFLACAIGGFLGYVIVEVIFAKGFATLKKSLALSIISALVMLGYGLFFQMGGFGFETRVPELSDVISVTISKVGIYDFPSSLESNNQIFGELPMKYTLSSEEAKQSLIDIHKKIVTQYKEEEERDHNLGYDSFYITYNLKGGKTLSRLYYIYGSKEIQKAFTELYDIDEVKKSSTFIFHTKAAIVDGISINNKFGSYTQKMKLSKTQINNLIDAMQKDTLNKNYNDIIEGSSNDLGTISFSIKNISHSYTNEKLLTRSLIISEDDKNTLKLLEEYGYIDIFTKGYDNIVNVLLFAEQGRNNNQLIQADERNYTVSDPYIPNHALFVNDIEDINTILEKGELYFVNTDKLEDSSVSFLVNYENGYSYSGYIRVKNIPLNVFENDTEYYSPEDKDISGLIDILEETRDYGSNMSYIVDIYNSKMLEIGEKYSVTQPPREKEEIILDDGNQVEKNKLLHSTPSVYLYYLKNTTK